jgi:hypothetical protein
MALKLETITASISALVIPGVRILDLDKIPVALTARDTPCLFPEPVGFVSNFTARHDSFDSGPLAPKTVEYDITYTFCFAPLGADRAFSLKAYADMVEQAFAIWDAILANDAITGAVDFQPKNNLYFGLVADPSGNKYHGCQFVFHVKEFVN